MDSREVETIDKTLRGGPSCRAAEEAGRRDKWCIPPHWGPMLSSPYTWRRTTTVIFSFPDPTLQHHRVPAWVSSLQTNDSNPPAYQSTGACISHVLAAPCLHNHHRVLNERIQEHVFRKVQSRVAPRRNGREEEPQVSMVRCCQTTDRWPGYPVACTRAERGGDT